MAFLQDGRLPLHYAAEGGHFLLIPEFMTVKSANINCVDKVMLTFSLWCNLKAYCIHLIFAASFPLQFLAI